MTTDSFDTDENGKIIEHWDVIAKYAPQTPSGYTSIDGPTETTDLDNTEENKKLVRGLVRDVLVGEEPGNIDEFISSKRYIQHNAEVPDGLEYFKPLVLRNVSRIMRQLRRNASCCSELGKRQAWKASCTGLTMPWQGVKLDADA